VPIDVRMVLRARGRKAEDADDLRAWLAELRGALMITDSVVLGCGQHGDERPSWHYVEADRSAGLAKRRCLACGFAVSLLDSEQRWTYPGMWSCRGCGHSIAELAAGLSAPDGSSVQWVALAARCVECGDVDGLTDFVLDGVPLSQVIAGL
jgi:hypothetical protein